MSKRDHSSIHPRRKARIGVLSALYAETLIHEEPIKILNDLYEREEFGRKSRKFMRALFLESIAQEDSCERLIKENLQNWEFSRIALLDKLILRMAITEMLFMHDVPPKVTITEAIEIAKEYSTSESSGFVNGILDAVFKSSGLKQPARAS